MQLQRHRESLRGWQSIQRLTSDGAVEAEQAVRLDRPVVVHSPLGAGELGRRYFSEVERSTLRLVQTRGSDTATNLRILGRGPVLLVFAPAEIVVSVDEVICRYAIRGGLLARGPRGELTLVQQRAPHLGLRSAITGFYPRLAARPGHPRWSRPLYALLQRRIHVWISRRFFRALVEESTR